jgi:transcriptional regulator with XRE-family HTH domain
MKLAQYLKDNEVKVTDFAEKVGVTATALQRYIDGERRPKAEVLEAIHRETNGKVQPNDFFGFTEAA